MKIPGIEIILKKELNKLNGSASSIYMRGIEINKKNNCINAIANKLFIIVCSVGSEIENRQPLAL